MMDYAFYAFWLVAIAAIQVSAVLTLAGVL